MDEQQEHQDRDPDDDEVGLLAPDVGHIEDPTTGWGLVFLGHQ